MYSQIKRVFKDLRKSPFGTIATLVVILLIFVFISLYQEAIGVIFQNLTSKRTAIEMDCGDQIVSNATDVTQNRGDCIKNEYKEPQISTTVISTSTEKQSGVFETIMDIEQTYAPGTDADFTYTYDQESLSCEQIDNTRTASVIEDGSMNQMIVRVRCLSSYPITNAEDIFQID